MSKESEDQDRTRDDDRRRGGLRRTTLVLLAVLGLAVAAGCGAERGEEGVDAGEIDVGDDLDGPAEEDPIGGDDPTLTDDQFEDGEGEEVVDGDLGDVDDVEGALTAELDITAGVVDDSESRGQALLECGPEGAAGALWLDGDAAEAACRALEEPEVRAALEPPEGDEVCAEVYGGPDVATIVGTVDGEQYDTVVDRRDACAISRWDVLAPLLPEPVGA